MICFHVSPYPSILWRIRYSLTFLKFHFELPMLRKILFLEKAFNLSSSLCSLQSSSLDTENREEISFTFSAFTLSPCRARARVIAAAASFHFASGLSGSCNVTNNQVSNWLLDTQHFYFSHVIRSVVPQFGQSVSF